MTDRTEELHACLLCGSTGAVLYPRVKDRLFGTQGEFGELECPACGLIWLSPRPAREELARFYEQYYTHDPPDDDIRPEKHPRFLGGLRDAVRDMVFCGYFGYRQVHTPHRWCRIGRALGHVRLIRLRATSELKELIPVHKRDGLLVDIGCGRGDFLVAMKRLGWNVLGIESDPASSAIAQRRGLTVQRVPFEQAEIPEESVDHITMNHVIEHFYDPIAVVKKCYRLLKTGGAVVLYAPNSQSLGRKRFGEHWLALDPPRHLYTWSRATIRTLLERGGFTDITAKTFARLAGGIYDTSMVLGQGVVTRGQTPPPQRGRRLFAWREALSCSLGLPVGEEVVALAVKHEGEA